MEISTLRSFLRIAEYRSFTRAAQECGLSQPAISQQIARLEDELGGPVFDRGGRSVTLTEVGERLRPRAEQIVALAEDTLRAVRDDGQTGRIVVAAIPTVAPYLLPEVLVRFVERYPKGQVEVYEEVTEALVRRCVQGELDVGVLALPVPLRGLVVERLFEEELLVVLPAGHPLASRSLLSIDELRGETFVLLNEAHCLSGSIESFCQQNAHQPIVSGRVNQLATVLEMVALGRGISLIPRTASRRDTGDRRVYRRLEPPAPRRTLAACWSPRRYRPKLVERFVEVLRELAGEVEQAGE